MLGSYSRPQHKQLHTIAVRPRHSQNRVARVLFAEGTTVYRKRSQCSRNNLLATLDQSQSLQKNLFIHRLQFSTLIPRKRSFARTATRSQHTSIHSFSEQVREPKTETNKTQPQPKKLLVTSKRVIPVWSAVKDSQWLQTIKPQIIHDLQTAVCKSNALHIQPPENWGYARYYLGKGNNSTLVHQVLSTRWWWTRCDDKASAHLVWTPWLDMQVLTTPFTASTLQIDPWCLPFAVRTATPFRLRSGQEVAVDISQLGFNLLTQSTSFLGLQPRSVSSQSLKIHNRLQRNHHLADKKCMFYNLKAYYKATEQNLQNYVPVTIHVTDVTDPRFRTFVNHVETGSYWIVKPGENSNRGQGIRVCSSASELTAAVHSSKHTCIIQQYIVRPLLVHGRKVDLRCFALLTCYNGVTQAYFYREGYLRTASKLFTLESCSDEFVHLTNDAIQAQSLDYGKYESGNKLSYKQFQQYLDQRFSVNFSTEVLPRIRGIVKDTVQAVFSRIKPTTFSFEVFGYDFLLDSDLKPWLLEVNTNPCLDTGPAVLAELIPHMLDNAFRIAVDPLFPAPTNSIKPGPSLAENKFELIFHSAIDGRQLHDNLERQGRLQQFLQAGWSDSKRY